MPRRLLSNIPINQIKGLYGDVVNTVRNSDMPLTYAIRNKEARQAFDKLTPEQRASFEWDKGSISGRRAAVLGASAYSGIDASYRTVSGGSAYRNKDGKKDIVGIPLI